MENLELNIFSFLLTDPFNRRPIESVEHWHSEHLEITQNWFKPEFGFGSESPALTIDKAAECGLQMDRLGWAFSSGYQLAMEALIGPKHANELHGRKLCLCATEGVAGAPPASIATRITRQPGGGWLISGEKSFVTLGEYADVLAIVCREDATWDHRNMPPPAPKPQPKSREQKQQSQFDAKKQSKAPSGERVRIRIALVDAKAEGVRVEPSSRKLPFIPEIPHAKVQLRAVRVADAALLDGDTSKLDGYTDFLKPFRTIEDSHVAAALIGHGMRNARLFNWPRELRQSLLTELAVLRQVSALGPKSLVAHVLLAGVQQRTGRLLLGEAADALWEAPLPVGEPLTVDVTESYRAAVRERWRRDAFPLLGVASAARDKRIALAWSGIEACAAAVEAMTNEAMQKANSAAAGEGSPPIARSRL